MGAELFLVWQSLFGGRRKPQHQSWVRINDDSPISIKEIPQYKTESCEGLNLVDGDWITFPDGNSWGCIKDGNYHTAHMVRVRRLGAKE